MVLLISSRAYPQHDASHIPPQSGISFGGYGYAGNYHYNTMSYTSSSSGDEYKQEMELELQQHEKKHVKSPHQKKDYVDNTHVFGHVQKDIQYYNQPYQNGVIKQNCEDQQK